MLTPANRWAHSSWPDTRARTRGSVLTRLRAVSLTHHPQVTSGVFFLYCIAYVTAMTIDPAEASVRCKIYRAPRPSFDRAHQAHVIQDQYCSLCDAIV